MPKKVKFRKQQRGRMAGKAWRGSDVSFGDYGLKALEPCWLTDRQIEAARVAMTRFIARGGKIAYFEAIGFQDREKKTPMKKDAIFRLASMTKPIVSVAAMMLVEEGKLDLLAPVSKYLPEFKDLKVGVERTDIVGGKRFADAIALGAGPMDLHESNGTGLALWVPELPFEIPFGCLLPQSVEGLVVAGRAMSATREANGGSRHMGTAMCLGEAAGVYAALAARGAARLAAPPYEEIRRVLRARGALVAVEDALAAAGEAGATKDMLPA